MQVKLNTIVAAVIATLATSAALNANAWTVTPTSTPLVNEAGVTVPAAVFRPVGNGPFPAVVMMHGCSGYFSNSDSTAGMASLYREWGDRLVANGYMAIMIDSFTGRGADQNQCGNGSVGTNEVTERPLDARAALNYLASRNDVIATRIGLLGWSNGGSATLSTMEQSNNSGNNRFHAAVAFYPGCGLWNAFGGISGSTYMPSAPIAIMHGSTDALYTSNACTTRINNATAMGAGMATMNAMSMTVFSGAKHSFDSARTATNGFTSADVSAKISADVLAMTHFDMYLMN